MVWTLIVSHGIKCHGFLSQLRWLHYAISNLSPYTIQTKAVFAMSLGHKYWDMTFLPTEVLLCRHCLVVYTEVFPLSTPCHSPGLFLFNPDYASISFYRYHIMILRSQNIPSSNFCLWLLQELPCCSSHLPQTLWNSWFDLLYLSWVVVLKSVQTKLLNEI